MSSLLTVEEHQRFAAKAARFGLLPTQYATMLLRRHIAEDAAPLAPEMQERENA
jgi:hypothetical protein